VVDDRGRSWVQQYAIRAVYWFDRPYNLLEVFAPDGALVELYMHIASPARLAGGVLEYTDHELDVVLSPGEAPRVVELLLVRWPTGSPPEVALGVSES
jgi:predicted RNA-binding protein associated with RNAse of E/G family